MHRLTVARAPRAEWAAAGAAGAAGASSVVRMRGLPPRATAADVTAFFEVRS